MTENNSFDGVEKDNDVEKDSDVEEECVGEEIEEDGDGIFEDEEDTVKKDTKNKKTSYRKEKKVVNKKDKIGMDMSSMFFGLGGEPIETGIYAFDIVLGGGFERGDIIELSSESGVGKTTIMLDVCSRLLKRGFTVAYIDVETGVKKPLLENMCFDLSKVGTIAGESEFLLVSPQNFNELDDVMDILLNKTKRKYDIIVIDSLSNVKPYKKDMKVDDREFGLRARQEGNFFTKYKADFRKSGSTFFIINQMRVATKQTGSLMYTYMDSTTANCGKHNCDIRLRFEPSTKKLYRKEKTILGSKIKKDIRDDTETVYGCVARLKALKNRNTRPEIPVDTHIIYGKGISNVGFLIEVLKNIKLVEIGYGKSWEAKESDNFPMSGVKGVSLQSLYKEVKVREKEIVDYLKENGHWSLVSGIVE